MRILFITSSLEVSDGWGRYSHGVVKEVSKNNEVFVVNNHFHDVDGVHQATLLYSPLSVANPIKIILNSRKIQNIINSFKPEVIHFLVESYVVVLPFLNLDKDTKTFLTVHGTYSFIPKMFLGEKLKLFIVSKLIKKAYKKLNRIISVSSFTMEYLISQYKAFYKEDLDQEKISVVTNGIDLSSFSFDLKKENHDKKSIIFVGGVKRRKGVLESINSLAKYKEKYNDKFVYTIIGFCDENDLYVKQIKSKIVELGLQGNVIFAGFVSNDKLQSFYANADLFIMLSVQSGLSIEGFGLVYLEANAYGVPTIGSTVSGAIDAISEGISGYLVDPNDYDKVADRVHHILDEGCIKSLNCVEWAKKQDIKEKVKLILDYYGRN